MILPAAPFRLSLSGLLAVAFLLSSSAAQAQEARDPWSCTVYLQQSWPKQTETNRQIKDINTAIGSTFKTWDDVANLNLGVQVFRELNPRWKVGLELDLSRGKISGTNTVDTLAGPATASFEQKYTLYADLMAVAQYRPLGNEGRWIPFLMAGVGVAYEKDRTLLTLRNDLLDDTLLQVDNNGWFPIFTAGAGIDVYFSGRRGWYAEIGLSYSWARLKHEVAASGSMAPPTVTADTDSTGPNVWLGIGRRF
jgi:opacity protein-like surface antigen